MKFSNEAKVGALVLSTLIIGFIFAWAVGIENPFKKNFHFYVTYEFAGGIEVGSPVRVSGIKVGQVEQIDFFVPVEKQIISHKEPGSAHADNSENEHIVPIRLKLSVLKKAVKGIRKDSRFYINLAGIIGERYIEITPGSADTPAIKTGEVVAGVNPPRIDQLISQSFDLAGRITDVIERNKGDITRSIELLYKLSTNFNETLKWVDKSKFFKTDMSKLINNLIAITSSVRTVTDKAHSPEGEKTLQLLYDLLWRLEPLDSKTIRTFLQEEGVKVQLF